MADNTPDIAIIGYDAFTNNGLNKRGKGCLIEKTLSAPWYNQTTFHNANDSIRLTVAIERQDVVISCIFRPLIRHHFEFLPHLCT